MYILWKIADTPFPWDGDVRVNKWTDKKTKIITGECSDGWAHKQPESFSTAETKTDKQTEWFLLRTDGQTELRNYMPPH